MDVKLQANSDDAKMLQLNFSISLLHSLHTVSNNAPESLKKCSLLGVANNIIRNRPDILISGLQAFLHKTVNIIIIIKVETMLNINIAPNNIHSYVQQQYIKWCYGEERVFFTFLETFWLDTIVRKDVLFLWKIIKKQKNLKFKMSINLHS